MRCFISFLYNVMGLIPKFNKAYICKIKSGLEQLNNARSHPIWACWITSRNSDIAWAFRRLISQSTLCWKACSEQQQSKHRGSVLISRLWGESGHRWICFTRTNNVETVSMASRRPDEKFLGQCTLVASRLISSISHQPCGVQRQRPIKNSFGVRQISHLFLWYCIIKQTLTWYIICKQNVGSFAHFFILIADRLFSPFGPAFTNMV